jgi:type II secretion system protein H
LVKRAGMTLIEILLVLAIMVAVAALAAPAFQNMMRDARLQSAADELRVEFTRAHVKAMKTGRIQVFRFEIGGTRFSVQPYAASDDQIEAAPAVLGFGTDDGEVASARMDDSQAVTLPEGVTFAGGSAALESRSQSIEEEIDEANMFGGDWSQPILFYPDGSSSDAWVIVANEREVAIRVNLRGMTSASRLSEITDLEELFNQAELESP